jgi:hypothetical protein
VASHVLVSFDWTYRQPSDYGTQATNLFNLSDFIPFHLSSRNDHLTYISFILWTFCSKGDTRHATCRHAAHCELDALFDHGSHDMTTCITLPSTSLTQPSIGDLTDGLPQHSKLLLKAPILGNYPRAPTPIHMEICIKDQNSLLPLAAITMQQRMTRTVRPNNNSSKHLSSILLEYCHQSSPGSPFTFYIYSFHSFSGCTLKTRTLSIMRMRTVGIGA